MPTVSPLRGGATSTLSYDIKVWQASYGSTWGKHMAPARRERARGTLESGLLGADELNSEGFAMNSLVSILVAHIAPKSGAPKRSELPLQKSGGAGRSRSWSIDPNVGAAEHEST